MRAVVGVKTPAMALAVFWGIYPIERELHGLFDGKRKGEYGTTRQP